MKQREFARWCKTEMTFRKPQAGDQARILELLHRTHQLNATGKIYSESQVRKFLTHRGYQVFVADLKDRFVDYGTIGVAICSCNGTTWRLISFLLSCRILGRGVGNVFLNWLQRRARDEGVDTLEGLYVPAQKNQRMRALFTLSNFKPVQQDVHSAIIFSRPCRKHFNPPDWITVHERGPV